MPHNPINPSTTIQYSIPIEVGGRNSDVRLVVYDVLGREVATLVDEKQKAGIYEVRFNPLSIGLSTNRRLTSGIYFYQLIVYSADHNEIFNESKKMILVK